MSWNDKLNDTRNQLRGLNKTIPDTTRAFGALGKAVKEGGTLDFKTKEFVALGIAVAMRCEACIVLHCDALLKAGASPKGRKALAEKTGLSAHQILEWTNRCDLMRVRGVGEEYSDLLEASGVDTVKELRNRNAANLTKKMEEVNAAKKLVRRVPALSMVERWVAHAKKLPPVMTY